MNTKHYNRGSQNRYPHWNHFLTALFVAAMVMISTVPAFAVEATANTSIPETEVPISTPDLLGNPADGDGAYPDETGEFEPAPKPTSGPVLTAEELLDAIAHANENEVIEFDGSIQIPYDDLVLGRADYPVTIRRATSEARLILGESWTGNIKVQNITFDGAEIQSRTALITTSSLTQTFEKCNFVNHVSDSVPALEITYGDTFISDCHFSNNVGGVGAHFRTDGRRTSIENCTFTGGYAIYKGPVFICTTEETLMIGCTVSGNVAEEQAGGVYVGRGVLSVAESKIYGNTANDVADDITKDYWARLSLVDNYDELVELYKSDGVIPNRWTVDSRFNGPREMEQYHADMIFSMTFSDNEPLSPPSPASITLDKSELTLYVCETDTLTATIHPEGTSGNIQWASSDSSVASVTERGLITAHTAGTAVITATESVSGSSASCRVNIQEIPATTYSIDINANPIEGGIVNGGGQYEEGTTATVTAVPNEDFRFLAWTEADTQISTESSLTFTVTSDRMLTAIFKPISKPTPEPITYTINTSVAVGGTVNGAGKYEQGSSVTLAATPESGYRFIAWIENDERISSDESYTFIADRDRTIIAYFMPTCTINVGATLGGAISGGGGEFLKGSSVIRTAIPNSGYLFAGWTENGEQVSTNETITFIVDRDRTLVANFTPIPKPTYTIHVSATQGGTVEGGGSYGEGELITVNAVPDNGYRFLYWKENGIQVCTEAQNSFTAETYRTLVAIFDLIPHSTPSSPYEPSHNSGTLFGPSGDNTQPNTTSLPSQKEDKILTLNNGKATLIAPDDSFWEGYKIGQDNGAGTVTRADLSHLIYFMMDNESKKIYGVTKAPFRDVAPGTWYTAAVGVMRNAEIMVGCGDNLFCPDRTLTWGELFTVLARFAESEPSTEYYTGEHWAKDSINKAFALGWLEYTDAFDPGNIVTTVEMVDLIQAVFQWNNE